MYDWTAFGFTPQAFPADLCDQPAEDKRDPGVFNSTALFLCVAVNDMWPDRFRVVALHPYVYKKTPKSKPLYGWVDEAGNVLAACKQAVHPEDHDKVVAWKRLPNDKPVLFGPAHKGRSV